MVEVHRYAEAHGTSSRKCKSVLATFFTLSCLRVQVGETEPFICELLTNLTGIIQDLETHQIHMFYETVGLMISAETVPEKRDEYVVRMLKL